MITQKDLFARVRDMGLSIRKTEGGDYRIAYQYPGPLPGGHGRIARINAKIEAMACYTDDRDDAYGTAIHMACPAPLAAAREALLAAG
ncbi:hypothetical protein BABAYKA_00210 [Brevundimonas phage vB_BpoS-Babayka]|uniref:Uncharacterized protein n=1 Tax=Brevundimonas phage vB_BpoS-Babayka TaxID=2948596 RepID=A0A9E7SML2_9CAUD|nr:hypothetical protein BABAYKA_00210 [Brevundimonas phage vB_BpoS-Babayka]